MLSSFPFTFSKEQEQSSRILQTAVRQGKQRDQQFKRRSVGKQDFRARGQELVVASLVNYKILIENEQRPMA